MWREIFTVYRKEMRAYFVSPVPYFVMALFSGFMAYKFFFNENTAFFIYDRAEMYRGFFFNFENVLVLLVPLIGMRLWASEYNAGTIETLVTLPVRTSSIVIGKFLGGWTLVLVCLLATAAVPISVASLGELDWGPVHGGYLGAFLFCGALLALATWISSLTRHQILAAVITGACGGLFIGMYAWSTKLGSFFGPIAEQLSLVSHYQAMGRGVVDFRDVLYFFSFMAFFLYLNVQSVENRRYR